MIDPASAALDLDHAPWARPRGDHRHAGGERLDDGEAEAFGIGALDGDVRVFQQRPFLGALDGADCVHRLGVRREAGADPRDQAMLVGPGDHEMQRRPIGARRRKGVGEEIETLDPVQTAEKQDDEGVCRNAEAGTIAATRSIGGGEIHAVRHDRDGYVERERPQRVGLLIGGRVQHRGAPKVARFEETIGHSLAKAPAPHRCRLQHAARRDHVGDVSPAREVRRPPLGHVPEPVDVAHVRVRERLGQRRPHARAEKSPRKRRAGISHGHAVVLRAVRHRRQRRVAVRGRRHDLDVHARALQPLAQPEDRRGGSAVPKGRRKVRRHVKDAHAGQARSCLSGVVNSRPPSRA